MMHQHIDIITIDEQAKENGLAVIISDLISQNLQVHPDRKKIIDALYGRIGIVAKDEDSEVGITLSFGRGKLVILNGLKDAPEVIIESGYETLLLLPRFPMLFGFPVLTSKAAMKALCEMFCGRLQIKGAFLHLSNLIKLLRLMTV